MEVRKEAMRTHLDFERKEPHKVRGTPYIRDKGSVAIMFFFLRRKGVKFGLKRDSQFNKRVFVMENKNNIKSLRGRKDIQG